MEGGAQDLVPADYLAESAGERTTAETTTQPKATPAPESRAGSTAFKQPKTALAR
jgi:hypothetical protein